MEKQILVTVGSQDSASQTLRFMRGFFVNPGALKLTLFYVAPRVLAEQDDAFNPPPEDSPLLAAPHPVSQKGQAILDSGRKWLIDMGFPPDRVSLKLAPNQRGTAGDIIYEAEKGLYDAVVVGRRAMSRFEELFENSISNALIWESVTFPVWICRDVEAGRGNVLVCADGSRQSLTVADHVGFVLADQKAHTATVFHVEGNGGDPLEVVEKTRQAVIGGGLEPDRVLIKRVAAKDPVAAILAETHAGAYAAVAIGRRSGKPTGLARIFGSISSKLLTGLDKASVWLSR